MESLVVWGIGLFALGVLLFFVELLLPTGGIVGLSAFVSALGGVAAFWFHDGTLGITSLIALLVLTPLAFHFALRVIPNTPIGKLIILGDEQEDTERAEAQHQEDMHAMDDLIDREGRAVTDMHPVGTAEVDGEVYDALAEGGMVESGDTIRVVGISGSQIRVRRS